MTARSIKKPGNPEHNYVKIVITRSFTGMDMDRSSMYIKYQYVLSQGFYQRGDKGDVYKGRELLKTNHIDKLVDAVNKFIKEQKRIRYWQEWLKDARNLSRRIKASPQTKHDNTHLKARDALESAILRPIAKGEQENLDGRRLGLTIR